MSFIWLLRYREVFSFTIAELATSSEPSLKYWHSELVKALVAAEVNEWYCTKLLCQYSQYTEIGELLSAVLCQYVQPRRNGELQFDIPEHVACPAQLPLLLRGIRLHHDGNLWLTMRHSYLNYVPCDDLMTALADARWDMYKTWYIASYLLTLRAVVEAMSSNLIKMLMLIKKN